MRKFNRDWTFFFFLMIRRPPRSTQSRSSAASDVYKRQLPQTPFREEQERLDVANFYYAQEDELFAAAARDGFSWSVHRPHTVIGKAVGNAMNMGTTLAAYATLCREKHQAFTFPGSAAQWNGLTDMTDARLLAKHLLWAATTPAAANEAFNVVNGDVFRWNWMWGRIAEWFGVKAAPFDGTMRPLEKQMAEDAGLWRRIAERQGLAEPDLGLLASPWHTDADSVSYTHLTLPTISTLCRSRWS